MADNRVVIITDEEINKPEVFDDATSALIAIGLRDWSKEFFNENIVDLIKGKTVVYEGISYQFYTYDEFADLDDE